MAEGNFAQAEIRGKLGELAFKRGDIERAIDSFEAALRLLGPYVPRHFATLLVLFLWEVCVQTLHTLAPQPLVGRRRQEPDEAERLSWRLFSRLAHGYWFLHSKIHVLLAARYLRGMNLSGQPNRRWSSPNPIPNTLRP